MIKRIYKYKIPVQDEFTMELPQGAYILTVQSQREVPCIWAVVDPDAPLEPICFRVAGTGHDIEWDTVKRYIGTFQLCGGDLVFHLFEIHK